MMQALLSGFDSALTALRYALLGAAAVLAAVGGVDWLVRTRKISPFSPVARFMRASVDPLLKPIERRVVRAGGLPSSAPWWALGAVVLAGIILLSLLGFLRSEVAFIYASLTGGTRGIYRLLVTLVFTGTAARADRPRASLLVAAEPRRVVRALVACADGTDTQAAPPLHSDDRHDGHHTDRRMVPAWVSAGISSGAVANEQERRSPADRDGPRGFVANSLELFYCFAARSDTAVVSFSAFA